MFAVPPPSSSSLAASPRRRPRPAAASSSSPNTITELDNEDAPVPVRSSDKKRQSLLEYLASNPTALLTDHERCFDLVATAVLLAETLLSAAIVRYVPCKPHTTLSRP
jgi:alpha-1,3-mannosyltransferase